MKKILFVVNVDWFFDSHRLPIALKAIEQGYNVCLATTISKPESLENYRRYGIDVFQLHIDRSAKNLLSIPLLFFNLFQVFIVAKPDLVHLVTIQPVILGGIVARILRIRAVVYAISGLGCFFMSTSLYTRIRRRLILSLYKLALGNQAKKVIFQNNRDKDILIRYCGIHSSDTHILAGSGVDLSIFSFKPLPSGIPTVLLACRLLKSKGVHDFVKAATILKNRGCNIRFLLVGQPDFSNPSSVTNAELKDWKNNGYVEILGFRSDLSYLMSISHVVTLPSYYPEGLPKVLSEAAACGRPVITTDEPGCLDAIKLGITGLTVPPKSPILLADAILTLTHNKNLLYRMSYASRILAQERFDLEHIVASHILIYETLLSNISSAS